jgi:hypothetical protein
VEIGVVDRADIPDGHRLHDVAGELLPNATLNVDISPEYLGVGYDRSAHRGRDVRGRRAVLDGAAAAAVHSRQLHAGAFSPGACERSPDRGNERTAALERASGIRAPAPCWRGIITLARTIPTIVSSFRESVKDFGAGHTQASRIRTERDIPLMVVLGGSLLLAVFLAVAPSLPTRVTSSRRSSSWCSASFS